MTLHFSGSYLLLKGLPRVFVAGEAANEKAELVTAVDEWMNSHSIVFATTNLILQAPTLLNSPLTVSHALLSAF